MEDKKITSINLPSHKLKLIKWTEIINQIINAKNIHVSTDILSRYLFTPIDILNKIANDTLQIDFCDIHNAFNNIFIKINESFYKYYENIILDIIIKKCTNHCNIRYILQDDTGEDILIKCFIKTLKKYTFLFRSYNNIINIEKFLSLRDNAVKNIINRYGIVYKACDNCIDYNEYFDYDNETCFGIPKAEDNPFLYYINYLMSLSVFNVVGRNVNLIYCSIGCEYIVSNSILAYLKLYYNIEEKEIKNLFFNKINFETIVDTNIKDIFTFSKNFLVTNKILFSKEYDEIYLNISDYCYAPDIYHNIYKYKYGGLNDECTHYYYYNTYINHNISNIDTNYNKYIVMSNKLSLLERCKHELLGKKFNCVKLKYKIFTLRNPITNEIFINTHDEDKYNIIDISINYNTQFISTGRLYKNTLHICDVQCEIELYLGKIKIYLTENIKNKLETINDTDNKKFIDIIKLKKYTICDRNSNYCKFCNKCFL